jgi:hypothetical protein
MALDWIFSEWLYLMVDSLAMADFTCNSLVSFNLQLYTDLAAPYLSDAQHYACDGAFLNRG